ncbi:hypothetical protein F4604DRAFT_1673559 [Suillus subluteus]|nr:hypothetical protein F4604DRAFT_1673559 [Suillus subluteus]
MAKATAITQASIYSLFMSHPMMSDTIHQLYPLGRMNVCGDQHFHSVILNCLESATRLGGEQVHLEYLNYITHPSMHFSEDATILILPKQIVKLEVYCEIRQLKWSADEIFTKTAPLGCTREEAQRLDQDHFFPFRRPQLIIIEWPWFLLLLLFLELVEAKKRTPSHWERESMKSSLREGDREGVLHSRESDWRIEASVAKESTRQVPKAMCEKLEFERVAREVVEFQNTMRIGFREVEIDWKIDTEVSISRGVIRKEGSKASCRKGSPEIRVASCSTLPILWFGVHKLYEVGGLNEWGKWRKEEKVDLNDGLICARKRLRDIGMRYLTETNVPPVSPSAVCDDVQ